MNNKFCAAFLFSLLHFAFSYAQTVVTVDEVIQLALQKNYDIRLFQNTALSAYTDNRFAYGAFLPQFNVTAGASKSLNYTRNLAFLPLPAGQTSQETIGDGARVTTLTGSAQATWTIFDGTKMFATRKRISQLVSLSQINVRNQMMNSVASVMTNFYNIVRQEQQLKAVNEVMSVNLERVKLAERKLDVGTGAKPELLQAKVDLNAQRTALVQQEILIQQLKDQLNGLVGLGLPDGYSILDTIPINLDLKLDELLAEIENNNQTLLSAKKNIDVATLALRESRAARYPIVNLNGAFNYNRSENAFKATPATQQLTRLMGFTYGFTITIPFINNLNQTRLVNQAKINLERQQLIYDQQKTVAFVGVKVAFTNYENSKRILQIQEENILVAKENVAIALAGFKRGITTYIELRTANQSLSDAYNQLIAARFSTKSSEIELMRLTGALLK